MPIKFKQGSRRLTGQKLQQTPQQTPAVTAPPSITELEAKRDSLRGLLSKVEKQVGDLENKYVRSANPLGTAVTGYEGFLTGLAVPEQDMHIFSKSSVTAPQSPIGPADVLAVSTAAIAVQPRPQQSEAAAVQPQLVDTSVQIISKTDTAANGGSDAVGAVTDAAPQTTAARYG